MPAASHWPAAPPGHAPPPRARLPRSAPPLGRPPARSRRRRRRHWRRRRFVSAGPGESRPRPPPAPRRAGHGAAPGRPRVLRASRGGGLAAPPKGPRNCPQRVPPALPALTGLGERGCRDGESRHAARARLDVAVGSARVAQTRGGGPGPRVSAGPAGPGGVRALTKEPRGSNPPQARLSRPADTGRAPGKVSGGRGWQGRDTINNRYL